MKRIVITGATSSIGADLVQVCLNNGHQVIALARAGSGHLNRLPNLPGLQVVDFDLFNEDGPLNRALKEPCDIFYHLAWCGTGKADRDNAILQQKNIRCTLNMIKLAKDLGCKKFIGAGSQAEYGTHTQMPTGPESPASPSTAYGISKYAAGQLGAVLAKELEIDFFWVRLFSIYGKYDRKDTLIYTVLERIQTQAHYNIALGTYMWDYLHSKDAAEALFLIGEKARGRKVYCLGSGKACTLKEYVKAIRDVAAPEAVVEFEQMPYISRINSGMCADISLLHRDTGWLPAMDFPEGIRSLLYG